MNESNKLLLDESPLLVLPNLAVIFGVMDALILQQVHYWLQKSEHVFEERKWIYNSYPEWAKQLPFVSESAIKRTFLELESQGVILSGMFAEDRRDRAKWYTIDYVRLDTIVDAFVRCTDSKDTDGIGAKRPGEIGAKRPDPLSEITTETTTDIQPCSFATLLVADASHSKEEKLEAVIVPPAKRAATVAETAEDYRVRWNKFVDYANTKHGSVLKPVKVLSTKAITAAAARHKTKGFDFQKICNTIIRSKFLLGLVENPAEGKGKHWRGASFDFIFLHVHAWSKIINGEYDDTKVKQKEYIPLGRQAGEPSEASKEVADRIAKVLSKAVPGQ